MFIYYDIFFDEAPNPAIVKEMLNLLALVSALYFGALFSLACLINLLICFRSKLGPASFEG